MLCIRVLGLAVVTVLCRIVWWRIGGPNPEPPQLIKDYWGFVLYILQSEKSINPVVQLTLTLRH